MVHSQPPADRRKVVRDDRPLQLGGVFPSVGGTLYSYDTATSTYSTLYNFTGSQWSPQSDLIAVGSTIYGMSSNGVYSIGIDGSNYQVLHTFTGADGLVQYLPAPTYVIFQDLPGGLTAVGNVLYGTTGYTAYDNPNFQDGGPGEVFRINMDGTGFQIVHSFSETVSTAIGRLAI